jgi:hypothetical protein
MELLFLAASQSFLRALEMTFRDCQAGAKPWKSLFAETAITRLAPAGDYLQSRAYCRDPARKSDK